MCIKAQVFSACGDDDVCMTDRCVSVCVCVCVCVCERESHRERERERERERDRKKARKKFGSHWDSQLQN